jgi:4-hydroxy-3-methylbut-2-enyl diphosphate reductase
VVSEALRRRLFTLDATCPLVTKVHREAERHHAQGRHILLIGHAGHPEVVGTMGQLPEGAVTLVETVEAARAVAPPTGAPLAWTSQTTLSVDETAGILAVLAGRFPGLAGPAKDDICYATSNRQAAVKAVVARGARMVVVVGAAYSSNSVRRAGAESALVQRPADLDLDRVEGLAAIGLTAGASAPESLVHGVIAHLRTRFDLAVEEVRVAEETIEFRLPPALARPDGLASRTLAAD